jgi:hypothetical protein
MAGEITYNSYRISKLDNSIYYKTMGIGGNSNPSEGITGEFLLKTGDNATGDYSFDSDTFIIDSINHRVGIGNGSDTPYYLLDVGGDARFTGVVRIGDDALVTGRVVVSEEIIPSVGNSANNGICFPPNPGGGSGDLAFIRYYSVSGDTSKLIMGIDNDNIDTLVLYQYGADRLTIYDGKVGIGYATPTRNFEVNGTSYFNDYIYAHSHIGSDSFSSGFVGSGWKLDFTAGESTLTVDNLYVRKAMNVYELIINQIRATNGSVWISDCAKISNIEASGGSDWKCYIDTSGGAILQPFSIHDLIRCQRWNGRTLKFYVAEVVSIDAVNQAWFTIHTLTGNPPEIGDDVVRMGNTTSSSRQGAIYLTSSDSNAPYIDIIDGVSSSSLADKTKVRLGNLTGITDSIYGALSGYGMYGQNVYLTGFINASLGGLIGGFTIDPTNGLYSGSGSTRVQMKSGVGFWTGATAFADAPSSISNAGVCKFLSGVIGGFTIGSDYIRSSASGKRLYLSATNNNLIFYGVNDDGSFLDNITLGNTDATSARMELYLSNTYTSFLSAYAYSVKYDYSTTHFEFSVNVLTGAQLTIIAKGIPTASNNSGGTLKALSVNTTTGIIYHAD